MFDAIRQWYRAATLKPNPPVVTDLGTGTVIVDMDLPCSGFTSTRTDTGWRLRVWVRKDRLDAFKGALREVGM